MGSFPGLCVPSYAAGFSPEAECTFLRFLGFRRSCDLGQVCGGAPRRSCLSRTEIGRGHIPLGVDTCKVRPVHADTRSLQLQKSPNWADVKGSSNTSGCSTPRGVLVASCEDSVNQLIRWKHLALGPLWGSPQIFIRIRHDFERIKS